MKSIFTAFFLISLTASGFASDMRIGIIDMTRVFAEYHKTKDAEDKLNNDKVAIKKEMDERSTRAKELIAKYETLVSQIRDPGISDELRGVHQKKATTLAAEIRSLERERSEFIERRQKQLFEQLERARKAILEEIVKVVSEYAKVENYDLVFDKSGLSPRSIPFLLHSKEGIDFSEQIIAKLNHIKDTARF